MTLWIKKLARRYAPAGLKHRLRKWNSWRLVRSFPESRWPPAAGARQLIRPGDHVVDAGANIGYVTALFSGWVGPGGRVYSMEPEPGTFDILQHNVRRLGLANVELFRCAVSSCEAAGRLAIPRYSEGGENLYEARLISGSAPEPGVRTVEVQLNSLDHLLAARVESLAFIKLDVEGAELEAVQGAERLVKRFGPAFLIEVNGDPWEAGTPAARLFGLMQNWGYTPVFWAQGRWNPLKRGDKTPDVFFLRLDVTSR